ncbi:hypothetical protein FRB94_014135 [Tulasnella sp. JGI-2019a]|nr:hypothetical protein FRB94_014135 [Tulasnella sp. JGI-2019a]KAG9022823.1 hypothetical protein FRB95_014124 [Tulasnella sp. JGI-2019a]
MDIVVEDEGSEDVPIPTDYGSAVGAGFNVHLDALREATQMINTLDGPEMVFHSPFTGPPPGPLAPPNIFSL